jgi:hypothetical protein
LLDTSYSTLPAESNSPNFGQQQYLPIHDSIISRAESHTPIFGDVTRNQSHVFIEGDNDSAAFHAGLFQSSDIRSVFDFSATATTGPAFNAYDIATLTASEMQPSEAASIGVYATSISSFSQGNPPPGVATVNLQNEPLYNNKGGMICRHEGCENLVFNHKGEWK